jgi:hypothetical protein
MRSRNSRAHGLVGRRGGADGAACRGERGFRARTVRPAALGEVPPAAASAAELGDPGLDQLDRAYNSTRSPLYARARAPRAWSNPEQLMTIRLGGRAYDSFVPIPIGERANWTTRATGGRSAGGMAPILQTGAPAEMRASSGSEGRVTTGHPQPLWSHPETVAGAWPPDHGGWPC